MSEEDDNHIISFSNDRVDKGFDMLDEAVSRIFNELHLNYYEIQTVLAIMHKKIERNNLDQYMIETIDRFCKKQNEDDEAGR